MRFKTRTLRAIRASKGPFNKRESYDEIRTTGADKLCLAIMIGGALILSTIVFVTLGKPSIVQEVSAHEEAPEQMYIDTVQEDSFNFIVRYEKLHTVAYWDVKRWSIGCGTLSYAGETISIEEAKQRCRKRIDSKRRQYDLYKYDDNVEIALLSFEHNLGRMPHAYKWYIDNGHLNGLGNLMKKYANVCKYVEGERVCKQLRGLLNRRIDEKMVLVSGYKEAMEVINNR